MEQPASTKIKLEIEVEQEQYWKAKGASGFTLEENLVSFMKQHLLHWAIHKAYEKYGSV